MSGIHPQSRRTNIKRNDTRSKQRGFFAAGFGLGTWGPVELAESDAPVVAEPVQPAPTVAAHADGSAEAH